MPNKNYLRGRRYEWKIRKRLLSQGYYEVCRTAGSKSSFDLIAVDNDLGYTKYVQCKVLSKGTQADADRMGYKFLDKPPYKKSNHFAQELWVKYGRKEDSYTC